MSRIRKRFITVGIIALLCACGGSGIMHYSEWKKPSESEGLEYVNIPLEEIQPYHYRSITGQYLSALHARQTGQSSKALSYINEAIGIAPAGHGLETDAYSLALAAGDIDLAIHFAEKMDMSQHDAILSPSLLRAVAAIKNKDYATTRTHLQETPDKGFGFLLIQLIQAWVDVEEGNPIKAKELHQMAQQGGEFRLLMHYQLALLQDAAGENIFPINYYEELSKHTLLSTHIALRIAQHHKNNGNTKRYQELMQRFDISEKALQAHQVNSISAEHGIAEVFLNISTLLTAVNALDTAKIPLHIAEYMHPSLEAIIYTKAQIEEGLGNKEQAAKLYQSLKQDPLYGLASSLQLIYLLQDKGKTDQALEQATLLTSQHPADMSLWLAKGDILRGQESYKEAASAYTQAINTIETKRAEHWPSFYSRAISYERDGQWEKAEADFLEALRLQPDQPDVLNYLGYSWLVQNRHLSQAKAMIEKAMRARPRDAHIIDSMGWAYYQLGDYEKAVQYLERAATLSPHDATVNEHLGDVYWRMGYETQARFQWQRALAFEQAEPGQFETIEQKLISGLPKINTKPSKNTSHALSEAHNDARHAEVISETENPVE